MAGKFPLMCKGKILKCFALLPQVNFKANNLNFHWKWRWWDWIQAIFLTLFYISGSSIENNEYQPLVSSNLSLKKSSWGHVTTWTRSATAAPANPRWSSSSKFQGFRGHGKVQARTTITYRTMQLRKLWNCCHAKMHIDIFPQGLLKI